MLASVGKVLLLVNIITVLGGVAYEAKVYACLDPLPLGMIVDHHVGSLRGSGDLLSSQPCVGFISLSSLHVYILLIASLHRAVSFSVTCTYTPFTLAQLFRASTARC